MLDENTTIDEEVLSKWVERVPGCKIFLENFFLTCSEYSVVVNYLNYVHDLRLHSPTNRHIRENSSELITAFYEITGTSASMLERKLLHWKP